MAKGEGDHVSISPERDTPPRDSASGPWPGSETSWRDPPHNAVSPQILGAVLLVSAGLLLGATWTIQALQATLRRQAEERRQLNEAWSVVRSARRQRGACPRCASALSDQEWYFAPMTLVEDPPDDD